MLTVMQWIKQHQSYFLFTSYLLIFVGIKMIVMESSVLTTKGQIVIPKGLRDKYKLNPGTKVFFEETADGIILKHIDAAFIKKAKGIIPVKKGEKPMAEWWPEYKAEEKRFEERKLNLLGEPPAEYKKAVKIKRKK